jgi:RHS repeat-associated protein
VNSNPPERVVYTYDDPAVANSKGKLTKVSRLVNEVEVAADSVLEYDKMQRVRISRKKIKANDGSNVEKSFEKTYDSAGRMVSITYPGNKTYSYEYDVAGDLLYVKDNGAGNRLVEYSDFTALGQHRIANFPKPNNVSVKTTYSYDPRTARLKTLMTQKLVGGTPTETYQNLDYQQFDGAGNIKILADTKNNITHNYTYDHLNRLTLANGVGTNSYTQSYQYDRIGNITYKSDVGTYNYTYSSRPHAVNSTTGLINITLQYDANGNMTRRASGGITLDITYDYDNKPNLIKKNSINHVQFTYDGNGQRVKKYNYATGQSILYFGDLYEIRSGADTIHIFAGSRRVASVFLDGTTQFYHPNHLGSSSVVTDQYGARKEQIEYHPFGTYRAVGDIHGTYDFDPNFPDVFYTFTGQEDDDDLGLYNYGARLYDPVLGKFISPDSVVQAPDDPQTLNRYSYARNNPIIYTDPSGNVFIIDDIIYAVIGFLATYIGTTAATAVVSVVGGAMLGAATSAITGGNIGLGALTGAISGAIFFGVGEFVVPEVIGALGATGKPLAEAAVKVAVHTGCRCDIRRYK